MKRILLPKASLRENFNLSVIAAIADNNVIGGNNRLLWRLPNDLKRFKKITMGNIIIMGRKTFISLPGGALPGRTNIVLTRDKNFMPDNCIITGSIDETLDKCNSNKENIIIGGGTVYDQFIEYANKLYITKVHGSFDGDTYFPHIDLSKWKLTLQEDHPADEKHKYPYSFMEYKK